MTTQMELAEILSKLKKEKNSREPSPVAPIARKTRDNFNNSKIGFLEFRKEKYMSAKNDHCTEVRNARFEREKKEKEMLKREDEIWNLDQALNNDIDPNLNNGNGNSKMSNSVIGNSTSGMNSMNNVNNINAKTNWNSDIPINSNINTITNNNPNNDPNSDNLFPIVNINHIANIEEIPDIRCLFCPLCTNIIVDMEHCNNLNCCVYICGSCRDNLEDQEICQFCIQTRQEFTSELRDTDHWKNIISNLDKLKIICSKGCKTVHTYFKYDDHWLSCESESRGYNNCELINGKHHLINDKIEFYINELRAKKSEILMKNQIINNLVSDKEKLKEKLIEVQDKEIAEAAMIDKKGSHEITKEIKQIKKIKPQTNKQFNENKDTNLVNDQTMDIDNNQINDEAINIDNSQINDQFNNDNDNLPFNTDDQPFEANNDNLNSLPCESNKANNETNDHTSIQPFETNTNDLNNSNDRSKNNQINNTNLNHQYYQAKLLEKDKIINELLLDIETREKIKNEIERNRREKKKLNQELNRRASTIDQIKKKVKEYKSEGRDISTASNSNIESNWFSGSNDGISGGVSSNAVKILKSRRIKMIGHKTKRKK